jgi:hypothetical protein
MGNLEGTVWLVATGWGDLLDPGALASLPESIWRLLAVTLLIAFLITLFFKELRLSTFDPGLAQSLGFRPGWLSAGLVGAVALAAVAAFDAVGSILVIAMFICPAATARMLTDDLARQSAERACRRALGGPGLCRRRLRAAPARLRHRAQRRGCDGRHGGRPPASGHAPRTALRRAHPPLARALRSEVRRV